MKNTVAVIEKETKDITIQAIEIAISNQKQYEGANDFLRAVKVLQKRIHETFDPIVEAAHLTHKEATSKRKEHLDPALNAEKVVKSKMLSYSDEMEQIRREEQRKLELKAKAEEDRKRKILEARAKKWADKGNDAKAEELQEQAEDVHVETAVVAPKVDKVAGLSYQTIWKFKIVDSDKIPRVYLMPDEVKLKKFATAMKGAVPIPGIEFYSEKIQKSRI